MVVGTASHSFEPLPVARLGRVAFCAGFLRGLPTGTTRGFSPGPRTWERNRPVRARGAPRTAAGTWAITSTLYSQVFYTWTMY